MNEPASKVWEFLVNLQPTGNLTNTPPLGCYRSKDVGGMGRGVAENSSTAAR